MSRSFDSVQHLYRGDGRVRGKVGSDLHAAGNIYRRYVAYVLAHAPGTHSRVLDVGCGNGWSTSLLSEAGHDAYGVDLHTHALEVGQASRRVRYAAADGRRLPFADAVFDVVGMYQVLEHIPEPEAALAEAVRVLRPGGRLVVVGPHLLSPGLAGYFVIKGMWEAIRRGGRWTSRGPDTPRHPYGNTLPETVASFFHHLRHSLRKLAGERPVRFLRRVPDDRPPFHADNDACYFCNPMDLLLWAGQDGRNLRPVAWWATDSNWARLLWPVAGGTWLVLEKRPSRA